MGKKFVNRSEPYVTTIPRYACYVLLSFGGGKFFDRTLRDHRFIIHTHYASTAFNVPDNPILPPHYNNNNTKKTQAPIGSFGLAFPSIA